MISAFAVAMPVSAAAITVGSGKTHATIQAAIDVASSGDIIEVYAGTYTGDLDIPDTLTNLELVAVETGVTIKGVANVAEGLWPLVAANINIWADGVKVHGFTIEGPDYEAEYYSSGMVIGGANVEIYDNDFKATGAETIDEISQTIQTYHKDGILFDVSGLNIHDNTFAALAVSTAGYEGIYVNSDAETDTVTIKDNTFTGKVFRAISTERSKTDIIDNTIITDLLSVNVFSAGNGYMGIFVADYGFLAQSSVNVIGNTISGSGTDKGFGRGMRIGLGQALTGIVITKNTIEDNEIGIQVASSAGGVTVNLNNIVGNDMGVENTDSAELDSELNWWGHVDGPYAGDPVSGNIDFSPWLSELYTSSTTVLNVMVEGDTEVVSISVDTSVNFANPSPGDEVYRSVSVENTGTVSVDVTATLMGENPVDFYTDNLKMEDTTSAWVPVVDWDLTIATGTDYAELQLTIPDPTAPGSKTATLVFWAEASPPI